jgi:hypothetical protein
VLPNAAILGHQEHHEHLAPHVSCVARAPPPSRQFAARGGQFSPGHHTSVVRCMERVLLLPPVRNRPPPLLPGEIPNATMHPRRKL